MQRTSILFVFFLLLLICSCSTREKLLTESPKQKGAHVFRITDTTDFQELQKTNIEWITLVSWAYQEDYNTPHLDHYFGDPDKTERNERWIKRIKMVKDKGFKVFFKPHVWLNNPSEGAWRSEIFPENDTDWEIWKKQYEEFILRYAAVAEEAQADMFCVGTEFTRLTLEKPEYWRDLISKVRRVYSGKLIYAANWHKEYEEISFWNDLDYIGVQSYFPLTEKHLPSTEEIGKGWSKYLPVLDSLHRVHSRKIIFTEMGYKSKSDGATRPWEWLEYTERQDSLYSLETQVNCYQAFFNNVWNEEWMAGVHIWQWRIGTRNDRINMDFTPQYKPAQKTIAKGFE